MTGEGHQSTRTSLSRLGARGSELMDDAKKSLFLNTDAALAAVGASPCCTVALCSGSAQPPSLPSSSSSVRGRRGSPSSSLASLFY